MKCPMCESERPRRRMVLVDAGEDYVWICDLCRRSVLEWVKHAFVVHDEYEDDEGDASGSCGP